MYPLDIYLPAIHDATPARPHIAKCAMCGAPGRPLSSNDFNAARSPATKSFGCSRAANGRPCQPSFLINEFGIRALANSSGLSSEIVGQVPHAVVSAQVDNCTEIFGFYITKPDRVRKCSLGL
jgi:hypothetical protein